MQNSPSRAIRFHKLRGLQVAQPLKLNIVDIDDGFPVRVETSRDVGARFENRPETELLVRFGDGFLEAEAALDVGPSIGEASGVEQDEVIAADAEVLEMRVDGEQ